MKAFALSLTSFIILIAGMQAYAGDCHPTRLDPVCQKAEVQNSAEGSFGGVEVGHPPFPDCVFKCGGWICPPIKVNSNEMSEDEAANAEILDILMNMCK